MKLECKGEINQRYTHKMVDKAVKEWLADYKGLPDEEIHTYASTVRENKELVSALYALFEKQPSVESLDPVCHQLYEFFRSTEPELRRFTLEFVPTLIWLYLTTLSKNDKKSCGGVEACLLGIYNLDIVDSAGNPKIHTFRIPNLGKSSVYHEPFSLNTASLTVSALSRYNNLEESWKSGPHSQYESINGQNRHAILAHLIECYYCDIAALTPRSQQAFCKACIKICSTGFKNIDLQGMIENNSHDHHSEKCNGIIQDEYPVTRLAVSPALLVEMLSCVYFIMYNGHPNLGIQTVEDIHARACYELYADVLLVTNAIRNSLKLNQSGQPMDGVMGMKISATTATPSTSLAKSAITNASFRTKKLPDDIPVPPEDADSSSKLASIDEDAGSDTQSVTPSNQGSSKHNFKIPVLHNLGKGGKKDKQRSKEGRKDSDASSRSSATQNGDSGSVENTKVAVTSRNQSKIVDAIELQSMIKKSSSLQEDSNMTVSNSSDDSSSVHSDKIGFMGHSSSTSTIREKKNNLTNSLTNPDSLNTDL